MSLSDSLVIKDKDNIDRTFVTVGRDGLSTSRIDTSSPDLSNTRILDIKHQTTGNAKAATQKDRHLVSIVETKTDEITRNAVSDAVNVTFTKSRSGGLSADELWDNWVLAKNTLTRENFDAMLLNQS